MLFPQSHLHGKIQIKVVSWKCKFHEGLILSYRERECAVSEGIRLKWREGRGEGKVLQDLGYQHMGTVAFSLGTPCRGDKTGERNGCPVHSRRQITNSTMLPKGKGGLEAGSYFIAPPEGWVNEQLS